MSLVSPKTNSVVDPDDYLHTYGYDTNGNLTTDTFTDAAGTVWTKTLTYSGSLLQTASAWSHA